MINPWGPPTCPAMEGNYLRAFRTAKMHYGSSEVALTTIGMTVLRVCSLKVAGLNGLVQYRNALIKNPDDHFLVKAGYGETNGIAVGDEGFEAISPISLNGSDEWTATRYVNAHHKFTEEDWSYLHTFLLNTIGDFGPIDEFGHLVI